MTRNTASVTVKLIGGPLNGKSAVSYGAVVGSLGAAPGRKWKNGTIILVPWAGRVPRATARP